MAKKIIGIKKMMTQIFDDKGRVVPVTVIDFGSTRISSVNDKSILVGFGTVKKASKALVGQYKDDSSVPSKVVTSEKLSDESKVGDLIDLTVLEGIELVDVSSISKGKGFQGVVKRWGFKGGPKTHGQSDRHRAPGSIGAGSTPGRVWKGKKMAGRMGGQKVTVKNLRLVNVDADNRLVLVKGAVPGTNGSYVTLSFK